MRYQNEECVRKRGIPHQVSEYPAVKYLQSDDAKAREWAASHSDELETLDKKMKAYAAESKSTRTEENLR